jgi:hypothetical protein
MYLSKKNGGLDEAPQAYKNTEDVMKSRSR